MSNKNLNAPPKKIILNKKATLKLPILLALVAVVISSSFVLPFWLSKPPIVAVVEEYSEIKKVTYLGNSFDCVLPYYNLDENIIQRIKSSLGLQTLIHVFTYNLAEIGKNYNYSIFETEILPNESFEMPNLIDVIWIINNGKLEILKYSSMLIKLLDRHENSTVIYEGNVNGKQMKFEEIYRNYTYEVNSYMEEWICRPRGGETPPPCPLPDGCDKNGYVVKIAEQLVLVYAFFENDWTLMSKTSAKGKFYIIPGIRVEKVDDLSYDWIGWYTYRCTFTHSKEGEGTISAIVRAYGKYREGICSYIATTHWEASPYVAVDAFLNIERNPSPANWWVQFFSCCY
jgi:hypothetical protein